MISIARLLFAVTVVLMFALLLIFYSFGYAGNGGEYWGFDGYIDAEKLQQLQPATWSLLRKPGN
jgi:hypothetical protein